MNDEMFARITPEDWKCGQNRVCVQCSWYVRMT